MLANRRRILFQLTESYQQFSSSVDEDEYSLHNREFKQHDSSLAIATRIVSVVNNASVDLSTPTIDQSKLLLCVAVIHFTATTKIISIIRLRCEHPSDTIRRPPAF